MTQKGLKQKNCQRKYLSAVWRSHSSGIHNFAPPPHGGFTFSRIVSYLSGKHKVTTKFTLISYTVFE